MGISIVNELGLMMTAIIVAGRSGSAFAKGMNAAMARFSRELISDIGTAFTAPRPR